MEYDQIIEDQGQTIKQDSKFTEDAYKTSEENQSLEEITSIKKEFKINKDINGQYEPKKCQDQQNIKKDPITMKEHQHKESQDICDMKEHHFHQETTDQKVLMEDHHHHQKINNQNDWRKGYYQESQDQIETEDQPFPFIAGMFGSISQLDGLDDIDLKDDDKAMKRIFAVNCEIKEIIQLVNFLRSFNFLWISPEYHCLCSSVDSCSFCHMRSSFLRLRKEREKGPRSLKLNEFISVLNQYDSILQWDWRTNLANLSKFIENTLRLLTNDEKRLETLFIGSTDQCEECYQDKQSTEKFIIKIDPGLLTKQDQVVSIKDLVLEVLRKRDLSKCCHSVFDSKCVILELSLPTSINILDNEEFNGLSTSYKSHVEEGSKQGPHAHFRFNNRKYSQGNDNFIYGSNFGIRKNVTMIAVYITEKKSLQVIENVDNFIYDKSVQLRLHKTYLKHVDFFA